MIYYYDPNQGMYIEADSLIEFMVTTWLGDYCTSYMVKEVIANLKYRTKHLKLSHLPLELVPLKKGLFNLGSRQLEAFTPEYFYTSKLPITYNKDADCLQIKKAVAQILHPDDVLAFFESVDTVSFVNMFSRKLLSSRVKEQTANQLCST